MGPRLPPKSGIFVAEDGVEPKFSLWQRPKAVTKLSKFDYAGAHLIGKKVAGFDLKIADENQI